MRLVLAATAVMLMGGCAVDSGGTRAQQQAIIEPAEPARRTYVLGTELTRDGAVALRAAGETFRRGGHIYLSIDVSSASSDQRVEVEWLDTKGNVSSASSDQRVEVEWLDTKGNVIDRQARQVPQTADYAAFKATPANWDLGEHHVVIVIDGRKVTELDFLLI